MEFFAQGHPDGKLNFGSDFARSNFKEFLRTNGPIRIRLTPVLPESRKLRKFYEGAIVPLVAFYQEGFDHRDWRDVEKVRNWLKQEFNGELVEIDGTIHKVGLSTAGREVLNPFVEKVTDWLTDNYQPPAEALNPANYKHWKDVVFPKGGPENYIDYLVATRKLTAAQ